MKKTTLSLAVACAMGLSAAANAYQFEVNAGFDRLQTSSFDDDVWTISGTAYLQPVDDSVGPYAEAAFLNKSSFLSLGYANLDGDVIDGHAYSIGGEYVIEGSNVILGAAFTRFDLDSPLDDGDSFAFTVGMYLNDTTTLRLNYDYQDWDNSDDQYLDLTVRHLTEDMGNGMRVAVEGSVGWFEIDPDGMGSADAWTIGVGADLYINTQLSVGAGVNYAHGDNEVEGYDWDLRARYFFTPQFAANIGYGELNPDWGRTTKAWTIGLTGRF